jgi:site-specific recombinase XerD
VRGYARDVGDFLRWYGAAALERLSVVDLVHYREHLIRERNAKPATVNRKLEALRRFTRWAYAGGKLAVRSGRSSNWPGRCGGDAPRG